MEETITISGKTYLIDHVLSSNKHASARLKGSVITISIPSRWPLNEKERIGRSLLNKSIRNIERGRWGKRELKKIQFSHGQEFEILGKKFRITDSAKHEKIRKGIVRKVMPEIERRVKHLDSMHFGSGVKKISIRDNLSRWGSYSKNGNVSLNFKLLFAPSEILDYVIIHELAHSKFSSHGPRFWSVVERAMPDHKARRKWLKENGHGLGPR